MALPPGARPGLGVRSGAHPALSVAVRRSRRRRLPLADCCKALAGGRHPARPCRGCCSARGWPPGMGRGSHWLAEMQWSALSGCPVDALWESLHSGGESELQRASPSPRWTRLAARRRRYVPGSPLSHAVGQGGLAHPSGGTNVNSPCPPPPRSTFPENLCRRVCYLFLRSALILHQYPRSGPKTASLPPTSIGVLPLSRLSHVFPSPWESLVSSALCVVCPKHGIKLTLVLCSKRGRRDPDIVIHHSSIALS